MSESETPQVEVVGDPGLDFNQLHLLYAGLAAVGLAFFLSWWDLTKYRPDEYRGRDKAAVERKKDGEGQAEYQQRLDQLREVNALYQTQWDVNLRRNRAFYENEIGEDFLAQIVDDDAETQKTGTIRLRGWSTWTGWFGVLFAVMLLAALQAPKFAPQWNQFAWGVPWAGGLLFALYTLMAVVFYFSVPDKNGDGYAQGSGLGNYLAILGGGAAVVACYYLGKEAADKRIAELQAGGDSDSEDDADEEEVAEPPPAKNRLMDW